MKRHQVKHIPLCFELQSARARRGRYRGFLFSRKLEHGLGDHGVPHPFFLTFALLLLFLRRKRRRYGEIKYEKVSVLVLLSRIPSHLAAIKHSLDQIMKNRPVETKFDVFLLWNAAAVEECRGKQGFDRFRVLPYLLFESGASYQYWKQGLVWNCWIRKWPFQKIENLAFFFFSPHIRSCRKSRTELEKGKKRIKYWGVLWKRERGIERIRHDSFRLPQCRFIEISEMDGFFWLGLWMDFFDNLAKLCPIHFTVR